MNNDLLNILSHSKETDQQKLLDYLEGKLSPEEKHEIEKLLIDSDFDSDAAEGLQQVQDKSNIPAVVNELNKMLVKKLSKRRKKLLKKKSPELTIPVVATIIILLLIFMFYVLLRGRL
ncbi:hypothetical protein [Agriterribacter sp.]|uniref:hypothetical protein n=1 Tax=Agriterribacter sp. TaxID=2821509 RepID=UPI002D056F75|nr:hypothetical protein [Agriterribacter sp.]HRP56075.1 hypothetical protein [Agriterribacter sp.]